MDYLNEFEFSMDYDVFVEQQIQNQSSIVEYLNRCIALESGDIDFLRAYNESFKESAKEIISKIVTKIKTIISKFMERVGEVVRSDKAWFEKYKDTILKNPFKDRDLTMYKYDIDKLEKGFTIPDYNWNDFEAIAMAEDPKKEFISKYLNNMDPNKEIVEQIKTAVRGDNEVEINMNSLNRTELYNFCVNYGANNDAMTKCTNNLSKAESNINAELGKYSTELDSKAREEESSKQEMAMYEAMLLHEKVKDGGLNKPEEKSKSDGKPAGGTVTMQTGAEKVQLSQDKAKQDVDANLRNNANDTSNTSEKQDKVAKIQKGASDYFNSLGSMISAKATLLMEAYKDFRQILRIHVRDYVGTEGEGTTNGAEKNTTSSFTASDGTQYTVKQKHTIKSAKNEEDTNVIKYGSIYIRKGEPINDDGITKYSTEFADKSGIDKNNVITILELQPRNGGNSYYAVSDHGSPWIRYDADKKFGEKLKEKKDKLFGKKDKEEDK